MMLGLFIVQYVGGGKVEQIFLCGFDIDYGIDFFVIVDGMLVNMVSYVYGQGYVDLYFIILELICVVDFCKGFYVVFDGNFIIVGVVFFVMIN